MRSLFIKTGSIITSLLFALTLWAQEKDLKVDVDVNEEGKDWYMQPWVWALGAAVFILLLVAILKSGSAKKE